MTTLTRPLTPRQQALLDAIWTYWREHGYAPSIRDLQDMTRTSSTSVVFYTLRRLQHFGLIRMPYDGTERAIVPVGPCCPMCGRGDE